MRQRRLWWKVFSRIDGRVGSTIAIARALWMTIVAATIVALGIVGQLGKGDVTVPPASGEIAVQVSFRAGGIVCGRARRVT
jgi:hypothetical protein